MIDITERQAVAIAAAARVIKTLKLEKEDPVIRLRGIDPTREDETFCVKIHFWVGKNPKFLRIVNVSTVRTNVGWVPVTATIEGPEIKGFREVEHVWSFTTHGDPIQIC